MKQSKSIHLYLLSFLVLCNGALLFAQEKLPSAEEVKALQVKISPWEKWDIGESPSIPTHINNHSRPQAKLLGEEESFNEALAPFYHGVASGDPMPDGIVLWTRITPNEGEADTDITVNWRIATDTVFANIVQSGDFVTNALRDFTVKVILNNLEPGTTYYYGFTSPDGTHSLTGRTKTAPTGNVDRLRFAVVSCSNYKAGYFNAYGRIADRNDLDAVLHLGDYIYENGNYIAGIEGREELLPANEILELSDYRIRHAYYKLDADLISAHQQHPFITVWDDHESANNSWENGADNHNAGEGDWQERKSAAKQAYFEWLPIREQVGENPQKIYRSLNYGNLADLIMLDTRLEGREQQVPEDTDPELENPDRTILGPTQYEWFLDQLQNSTAKWKVIGNQVVFSPIETLNVLDNMDAWDGYPIERNSVIHFIDSLAINNVVILTGDVHVGIAADVTASPDSLYNPDNGDGAFAVEMVAASVSSSNLDEADDIGLPFSIEQIQGLALGVNPHGKFANLWAHGYFLLDLNEQQAQGDWWWVDTVAYRTNGEYQEQSWYTLDEENFLQAAPAPVADVADAPSPAPDLPPVSPPVGGLIDLPKPTKELVVFSAYPNPCASINQSSYALAKAQPLTISLHNAQGQQVAMLLNNKQQQAGIYSIRCNVQALPNGTYFYRFTTATGTITRKLVVVH